MLILLFGLGLWPLPGAFAGSHLFAQFDWGRGGGRAGCLLMSTFNPKPKPQTLSPKP